MPRNAKGIYRMVPTDQMQKAVDTVKKKSMSVRQATVQFDIKRSTLADHISGRIKVGRNSGRDTAFPAEVARKTRHGHDRSLLPLSGTAFLDKLGVMLSEDVTPHLHSGHRKSLPTSEQKI